MILLLWPVNVVDCLDRFSNTEPGLHVSDTSIAAPASLVAFSMW